MVVKEDGTKWACQSCLKGHRVSGCTHTDRPLQFVPKKGRPVTQCQHCRVERKKRSAHVKCDCGEKQHSKEKCIHLRNAETTHAEPGRELVSVPESEELAEQPCCCSHGEKCVCFGVKKGLECGTDLPPPHSRPKPRLTTTQSEGHLTVFANGHHKPVHRNNNAAHDANMPYRVHKPHAAHPHGFHAAGRRSVDSLVLTDKAAKLSVEQIQQMAAGNTLPSNAETQPSAPELQFGAFSIPTDSTAPSGADDFFALPSDKMFQPTETPTSGYPQSAMSDTSGDFNWNAFDWSTFGGLENTQPALTYASSNTISELGDHTPPDENGLGFNLQASNATVNESTTQPSDPAGPMGFAPADRQGESQPPNRWSLPPSFWVDSSTNAFAEFMAGLDPSITGAKNTSSGDMDPFRSLDLNMPITSTSDQGTAGLPTSLSMFAPADVPAGTWNQGPVDSSMHFNNAAMQATTGPDTMDFGYIGDPAPSEVNYRQNRPDPFFGLEPADPIDFSQDFSCNDIRETWSS